MDILEKKFFLNCVHAETANKTKGLIYIRKPKKIFLILRHLGMAHMEVTMIMGICILIILRHRKRCIKKLRQQNYS